MVSWCCKDDLGYVLREISWCKGSWSDGMGCWMFSHLCSEGLGAPVICTSVRKWLRMVLSWTKETDYMAYIQYLQDNIVRSLHSVSPLVIDLKIFLECQVFRYDLGFQRLLKVTEQKVAYSSFDQSREKDFIINNSYTKTATTYCFQNEPRSLETLQKTFPKCLSVRRTIPPEPLHELISTMWFEPLEHIFQLLFALTVSR